jgi:hypothetical protein
MMPALPQNRIVGMSYMTEIIDDSPDSCCFLLLSEGGIQESQLLGPDPSCLAREVDERPPQRGSA